MSKADMLGASTAFSQAGAARSARRTLIDQTMGVDTSAPGPLLNLRDIADNPENPRGHIDTNAPDFQALVESIAEIGVTSPISVCRAEAFLEHHPEHREAVGDRKYVLLAGHRRVTAARLAHRHTVPAQVDDTGADEPLVWALAENGLRADLNPMQQARTLKKLTDKPPLGKGMSQSKVGRSIGRSQPNISQLLSLLKLAPELQDLIESGELKQGEVRPWVKLPYDAQLAAYQQFREQASKPSAAATQTPDDLERPVLPTQTHNSVMTSGPGEAAGRPAAGPATPDPTHNSVMGLPHPPADSEAAPSAPIPAPTHNSVMGSTAETKNPEPAKPAHTHNSVMDQPGDAQGVDALPWDGEPAVLGKALAERVGKEKLPALIDVLMGLC
ncbi:ParB/RepB/Spo0J family partition protein [Streptomyces sp. Wb2n-11]|uniref:ParB/RepB/Spo0J family partition protein n=1 Tax=Streptomyces sp. Wb2n-11 TaxID=1030533 RepID=UPI000A727696|nr:ParB/RepB/Spo0J family partition protein [Streptomyces sp. Wb2n-11]